MNIDIIMRKGQSGEALSNHEIELLMLHAIDLLKFIETETRASIAHANLILESHYRTAA
jgi:hypothetical protein